MIRMDEETKNQLLLLTVSENKKSMAKMIRELIEVYKQSKEDLHGAEIEDVIS